MEQKQVSYIIYYDNDFGNIKIQEYLSRPIHPDLIYKDDEGENLIFCSYGQAFNFLNNTFMRDYIYDDFKRIEPVDWDSMKIE